MSSASPPPVTPRTRLLLLLPLLRSLPRGAVPRFRSLRPPPGAFEETRFFVCVVLCGHKGPPSSSPRKEKMVDTLNSKNSKKEKKKKRTRFLLHKKLNTTTEESFCLRRFDDDDHHHRERKRRSAAAVARGQRRVRVRPVLPREF